MALVDIKPFVKTDADVLAYWNLQEANATDTWDNGEGTASWDATPQSSNEPLVSTTVPNANWARTREGQNAQIATFADPGFPTGSFTIEMVVKSDNTPADTEGLFCQYPASGTRSFYTQINNATPRVVFGVSSNGSTFTNLTSATSIGTSWVYLAFVFTAGSRMEIYLNGSSDASLTSSIPASCANATDPIAFMHYNDDWGAGANAYDGLLAGVRVTNRARTSTEITAYWDGTETAMGGGGGPVARNAIFAFGGI